MEARLILYENYRRINSSFTGYLHREFQFNSYAYHELCDSIEELAETSPANGKLLYQIHRIYRDILHFYYEHRETLRFDNEDASSDEMENEEEFLLIESELYEVTPLFSFLDNAVARYIDTFGDGE